MEFDTEDQVLFSHDIVKPIFNVFVKSGNNTRICIKVFMYPMYFVPRLFEYYVVFFISYN